MIKLKDIIKESKWSDRNWGDPLPTLEDYIVEFKKNLKPTDGSKEVTFTNKDNYDDAVKSGDYKDPDSTDDDPTRGDPDDAWDDEEGRAKPKGKTDSDTDDDEPAGKLGGGDFERETEPERGEKPKGGAAKEITKDMKSISSSGGNNVLMHKGTADHIERHNKPGEGSVFSDDISMDDVQNAISEIPEEFYEKGGGVHTTTVPNAGYNLVQKASDIKKDHPNAKKIMVKKQVGYDREKKEPIMKEVPAYIIDDDKEKFKTDQLSVVVRPSNPDFMDDEVKNNSDVKKDLDGKKSHSVLTSFPGDPDVPTADKWEESGHAIIIPNGGKDADKTNWVEEPDTGGGGDLDTQIAKAEKEYKSASQASMGMGQNTSTNNPGYDIAALDAFKKLKALKAKKAGKKESITINGKQYKRISESVEPTIFDPHKEAKKQLGSLYTRMKGK